MRVLSLILGLVLGAGLARLGVDASALFEASRGAAATLVAAALERAGEADGAAAELTRMLLGAAIPGSVLALVAATARLTGSASKITVTVTACLGVGVSWVLDVLTVGLGLVLLAGVAVGLALGALRVLSWLLTGFVGAVGALVSAAALDPAGSLAHVAERASETWASPLWHGVLIGFAVLPIVGAAAVCIRTKSPHQHSGDSAGR